MNFILRAEPEEMSVTKGATCNFRTKRTARVKLVIFIIVRTLKCRIHKIAELMIFIIFFQRDKTSLSFHTDFLELFISETYSQTRGSDV